MNHPQTAAVGTAPPPNFLCIVEAILFVGGEPIAAGRLREILPDVDNEAIVAAVAELNQLYYRQGRPYEIRRVGAGYQMGLRPEFTGTLRRVHGHSREVRLSQAAVEVLSLVAYKQPVTSHEVDAIRGTDSAAILRHLRRRNLIDVVGRADDGRTAQYGTTGRFLELFHIGNLDELPRVQELEKL